MKFKMIACGDGSENAAICFFNEFANNVCKQAVDCDIKSLTLNHDTVVCHPSYMSVKIFECEAYGVDIPSPEEFPSLTMPNCSWSLARSPKTTYDSDDIDLVTIYSNQKCLYDGDVDDDYKGISRMPLEYHFAKSYLSEIFLKRAVGLEFRINPKYDVDNYKTFQDMMI